MTVRDNYFVRRFLPVLLLNVQSRRERVERLPVGNEIPRLIHQTFADANLDPLIQQEIRKMRETNPGWKYCFYSDQECAAFIEREYGPRILGYYNRINPKYGAARADLFRYLLMYRCGGIYLDIKSVAKLPLDSVIRSSDRFILSKWLNGPGEDFEGIGVHPALAHCVGGEFQQWHIIAAPGHPFLKAVIENVLRNIDCYIPSLHDTGKRGVLRLTGPIAYTLGIEPLRETCQHRMAREADLGLTYSVFGAHPGRPQFAIAKHYSLQTESIVRIGLVRQIVSVFFALVRSCYRRFSTASASAV